MGRSPTNTREKLLETANDLIWKSSYGSVSVDCICTAAGINKGSFYYYFSSKAELAVAVMEESYQNFEPEMAKVFSTSISTIDRFKNLATFIYEKQKDAYDKYGHVCGCPFASLGSEMAGNEELIRTKVDEIFHRKEEILIATLQEMVDNKQLPSATDLPAIAAEIHTLILGQVMMARIQNDLSNLKNNLESGLFQILALEKFAAEQVSA